MRHALILIAVAVFPVQAASQLRVQVDRSGEAERAAREVVLRYYRSGRGQVGSIPVDVRYAADQGGWPSSCVGTSLAECFGGDPDCRAVGFDRPSADASNFRLCTDRTVPALREWIVGVLDSAAVLAPLSDWIAGQRVGFAVKHGDLKRALAAAESCGATPWWCQALRGYARHQIAAGTGSAQFDSALASAPPRTAAWEIPMIPSSGDRGLHCEWTDLSLLIADDAMRSEYERSACGEVGSFDNLFWWLADPLWSTPENERRDEHFARNVQMRLRDQVLRAGNMYGDPGLDHLARAMPEENLEGISIRVDLDSARRPKNRIGASRGRSGG